MQGKRVILDDRHLARQHRVFALFIVIGLLVVLAVWFIQLRMAVDKGVLVQVRDDVSDFSTNWSDQWQSTIPETVAEEDTTVEDAVGNAIADWETKQEIGKRMNDALAGDETVDPEPVTTPETLVPQTE